jgi:hypothetical protein
VLHMLKGFNFIPCHNGTLKGGIIDVEKRMSKRKPI